MQNCWVAEAEKLIVGLEEESKSRRRLDNYLQVIFRRNAFDGADFVLVGFGGQR